MNNYPRAVILTALPVEYLAVRSHLTALKEDVHERHTVYERGLFTSGSTTWDVGIVEIGPGNSGAAMEAERAIGHFRPSIMLFVGVAGGLKGVSLGDVVAATKVYGYESGVSSDMFQPRPDVGESSYPLVQRARAVARKEDWLARVAGGVSGTPKAFVGPIAAGEKVVKSTVADVYQFLRSTYGDALAVEMEGRGFLTAVHASSMTGIVIRAISDCVQDKAAADAAGWQTIASRHAAAFAFELLAKVTPLADGSGSDFWTELTGVASSLYPKGPEERSVWARAGGDIGVLVLSADGRTNWFRAIEVLRNGGGGASVDVASLLDAMRQDYPRNRALMLLPQALPGLPEHQAQL